MQSSVKSSSLKLIIDTDVVDSYNAHYKILHPKSKLLAIKSPAHPSINEWTVKTRMAMNNLKQKWKDFICWIVETNELGEMKIEECDIEFTTYFKDKRRRDCDNYSPKFIFDGFVEAGLLVDDSSTRVKSLKIACGYDKENPRMEFLFLNIR